MGRLRTGLLVGGTAILGASVSARRRWDRTEDRTDGSPLLLPLGQERAVRSADGAVIAALDMGDTSLPPIVLAHGWTGDRRVWSAVARRLLAVGHRVVVYDQRGHGASTVGTDGLTLEALADDMRAVLEAVDAHDAVVGGHSMGGMTAQLFAIRHKDVLAERVASLALIATAASRVSWNDLSTRILSGLMGSPVTARLMALDSVGPFLVRSSHGKGIARSALDATRESWLATPDSVRAGFVPAMAAMDLTADLPSITVPTVVLAGSRDTLLPPSRSREIARLIPGARLITFPGAGHQLPFEVPDRVAEILGAAASAATARTADPT